jgi:hypothetical protein
MRFNELSDRTQTLLMIEYPTMTNAQRQRFATIAQLYRELKSELVAERQQIEHDNDLAAQIPHFAEAAAVGCATALCAALGEPTTDDGYSAKRGTGYKDLA